MEIQGGFTKRCCFLCLWDRRATAEHYIRRHWLEKDSWTPTIANIQNISLVDPKDVFVPPLHINLELIKNFVKALGKRNFNGFAFLCNRFPRISEAKIKEGIFVGPLIRKVLKDPNFEKTLTSVERRAWKAFDWLYANCLGNTMSPLFKEELKTMGFRMSLKVHFLISHLHFFPQTVRSEMSKVNNFIRTYKQWRQATKAFGIRK